MGEVAAVPTVSGEVRGSSNTHPKGNHPLVSNPFQVMEQDLACSDSSITGGTTTFESVLTASCVPYLDTDVQISGQASTIPIPIVEVEENLEENSSALVLAKSTMSARMTGCLVVGSESKKGDHSRESLQQPIPGSLEQSSISQTM